MSLPNLTDTQVSWVREIVELAEQAKPICRPNPAVGAVVVSDGRVIGRGFTQEVGKAHAEVMAIQEANAVSTSLLTLSSVNHSFVNQSLANTKDAELWVTLMPCGFAGRTPACTDLIIRSGIKKVFVLHKDPNPHNTTSESQLVDNGVTVHYLSVHYLGNFVGNSVQGFVEDSIEDTRSGKLTKLSWRYFLLNLDFYKRISTGNPSITIKYAMSADGRVANQSGQSKWITSKVAREQVHQERSYHDAVLVGAKTFLNDNPRLNVRTRTNVKQPLPIVVITKPLDTEEMTDNHLWQGDNPCLFILSNNTSALQDKMNGQNKCMVVPKGKHWWEDAYLKEMADRYELNSIYVEGGPTTHSALLFENSLVDRYSVYLAPVLFLGAGKHPLPSPTHFSGKARSNFPNYFPPQELWNSETKLLGRDVWIGGLYRRKQLEKLWETVAM